MAAASANRPSLERQKSLRVLEVAAGHASRGESAIFLVSEDAETPKAILKQLDEGEFAAYDSLLNNYEDDAVLPFIAKFEGVFEVPDAKGAVCKYLRMTNLLKDFRSPKVMDVKLGIRTFLERECGNSTLRRDLYERMLKHYPGQVTEEDRVNQGITKARWMRLRDMSSTVRTLGFRIDGIAGYRRGQKGDLDEELTRLRQRSEVCDEFCTFAKVAATDDGREPNGVSTVELAEQVLEVLQLMHSAFENSAFVREHECIGSSLLLVADAYGKAGVFWIDFGKTKPLPADRKVTHRSPWEPGNHEDGILMGLDNMVLVWGDVVELLHRDRASSGWRGAAKQRSFSGHSRPQLGQAPKKPPGVEEEPELDRSEWTQAASSTRNQASSPTRKIVKRVPKLGRSYTSPHHGYAFESLHSLLQVPSEPQAEVVAESFLRTVYDRMAERVCGLCGLRRPKSMSQC